MTVEQLRLLEVAEIPTIVEDGLDDDKKIDPRHPMILGYLDQFEATLGTGNLIWVEGLEWVDDDEDKILIAVHDGETYEPNGKRIERMLVAKYDDKKGNDTGRTSFVKGKAVLIEAQFAHATNQPAEAVYYHVDLADLGSGDQHDWITCLYDPEPVETGRFSQIIVGRIDKPSELEELTKDWWELKVF